MVDWKFPTSLYSHVILQGNPRLLAKALKETNRRCGALQQTFGSPQCLVIAKKVQWLQYNAPPMEQSLIS